MVASPTTSARLYRNEELKDVADAIDRMTFRAGSFEPPEPLLAPALHRILVAIDGSPGSRHALAWGAELSKRFKARLHVVSVAPSPETMAVITGMGGNWAAAGAIFDECNESARKDLDRARQELKDRGVTAEVDLQTGRPATAIVEYAAANGVDLVILGSHGHGLGERLNLGSIGSAVKHHVPCSILIARGPPTLKRAVLATDGSQRSRLAVKLGRDIAEAFGAKATLAHVIDMNSYGLGRTKAVKQGKAMMIQERMREMPSAKGIDTRVLYGPPAKQLRKLAKAEKAGLIVVGSRGLGGLKGLALGSVSDGLTHKADQSVLVVKPQAA